MGGGNSPPEANNSTNTGRRVSLFNIPDSSDDLVPAGHRGGIFGGTPVAVDVPAKETSIGAVQKLQDSPSGKDSLDGFLSSSSEQDSFGKPKFKATTPGTPDSIVNSFEASWARAQAESLKSKTQTNRKPIVSDSVPAIRKPVAR